MRQCVVNAGFTWHTPLEDHTKSVGEQFWIDLHEHFREEMEKLGIAPEIAKKAAYGVREEILRCQPFGEVLYSHTGCTVSSHCGPLCMGLMYCRK